MRIGIGVSEDLPLPVQVGIARDVEAAGLASLWTNEAAGRDALLLSQAWGLATSTLQVGIAVVPIWTRSPAQLAMSAATVQEATGGRLLLGLGVSHPATMGPWHDADFRRPLTAAEDTLTILRSLLAGERVDHDGVRSASRFALNIHPSVGANGLYLAAMGPRMLDLAGRLADGAFLNWSGAAEVTRSAERVRAAAAAADRPAPEIAAYVRVAVAEDRDAARAALALQVGSYCALPAYAAHFERQGLGAMVARVKAAFRDAGPDGVSGAIGDDELRTVGWWGSPADAPAEALAPLAAAGLDHLVARVVPVGDVASSVEQVIAAFAG